MKHLTKLSLIFLVTVFFYSCDEETPADGGDETFTAEQAATSLDNMSTNMNTDVVDMINSDGTQSLVNLVDIMGTQDIFAGRVDFDATSKSVFKQKMLSFKQIFIPKSAGFRAEDGRFIYANELGVYDYNATSALFERTGDSEIIEINFPTEGSSSNNASLKITAYSDIVIVDEMYEDYYPTEIAGNITVDGTEVLKINATANYNSIGDPESGNIALYIIPFDYVLTFDDTNTTSSTGSFSMTKGSENIIGTALTIVFQSADKQEVKSANGEVSYRTTALKGDIDVASMEAMGENSTADINDFFNMALYEGDQKIGDIMVEEMTEMVDGLEETNVNVYVVYSDGSKELLEDILMPVINEIEDLVTQLEG